MLHQVQLRKRRPNQLSALARHLLSLLRQNSPRQLQAVSRSAHHRNLRLQTFRTRAPRRQASRLVSLPQMRQQVSLLSALVVSLLQVRRRPPTHLSVIQHFRRLHRLALPTSLLARPSRSAHRQHPRMLRLAALRSALRLERHLQPLVNRLLALPRLNLQAFPSELLLRQHLMLVARQLILMHRPEVPSGQSEEHRSEGDEKSGSCIIRAV